MASNGTFGGLESPWGLETLVRLELPGDCGSGAVRNAICLRMFSAPSAAGNLLLMIFGLLWGAAAELRRAAPLERFLRTIVATFAYCLLFLVVASPRLRRLRGSEQRPASR